MKRKIIPTLEISDDISSLLHTHTCAHIASFNTVIVYWLLKFGLLLSFFFLWEGGGIKMKVNIACTHRFI